MFQPTAGNSQTPLSGPLSGSFPRGEYIVAGVSVVAAGSELCFAAGSIVYFDEFSGLEIHGRLVCAGTAQAGVVLTSLNDGPYNTSGRLPEGFDWNGIAVSPDAQMIDLSYTTIRYSSFGVRSASEIAPMRCVKVRFQNCGSGCFSLGGRDISVDAEGALDYTNVISAPAPEQQAVVPGVVAAAPLRPERSVPPDPRQVRRLWFRIGGAVVAAAGVALVLGGHFSAERDQREYLVQADGASATVWRDRRDDDVMIRNVGLGVLCLGAAGFGVSWVW